MLHSESTLALLRYCATALLRYCATALLRTCAFRGQISCDSLRRSMVPVARNGTAGLRCRLVRAEAKLMAPAAPNRSPWFPWQTRPRRT
jgi:hypothetical protein